MILNKRDKKHIESIIEYCKRNGMNNISSMGLYNHLAKLLKQIEIHKLTLEYLYKIPDMKNVLIKWYSEMHAEPSMKQIAPILKKAGSTLPEIRRAVADYMQSEGCSCCQDIDGHREHKKTLAKLLKVPKYNDGSGYDFGRFKTPEK